MIDLQPVCLSSLHKILADLASFRIGHRRLVAVEQMCRKEIIKKAMLALPAKRATALSSQWFSTEDAAHPLVCKWVATAN